MGMALGDGSRRHRSVHRIVAGGSMPFLGKAPLSKR